MSHPNIRVVNFSKQIHRFFYCSPSLPLGRSLSLQLRHTSSVRDNCRGRARLNVIEPRVWGQGNGICVRGICTHVNMFKEARGRFQVSCCITLCPIPLRRGLSLSLELGLWVESPCGYLVSTLHSTGITGIHTASHLAFLRVLGSGLRLSHLCNQLGAISQGPHPQAIPFYHFHLSHL